MIEKINNLSKTGKCYLINSSLVAMVLMSISLMFFIQLKVDNLQDKIYTIDSKITVLDDEIRVLEVEWVYLTRPERLRTLSERYLQNNGYISSIQIKDTTRLERYYVASLEKQLKKKQNLAMNEVKQKIN